MAQKNFFASKLNWLGILTFIAGLGGIANFLPPLWQKYLLATIGIATVALRTFFTSTTISNPGKPSPNGGTGAS